jgi:hypothetical protein
MSCWTRSLGPKRPRSAGNAGWPRRERKYNEERRYGFIRDQSTSPMRITKYQHRGMSEWQTPFLLVFWRCDKRKVSYASKNKGVRCPL